MKVYFKKMRGGAALPSRAQVSSVAVQATAFWAIERAYNDAWQRPGPMKPPYDEFADRWGNSGFTSYVDLLATQAGEALAATNSEIVAQAHEAFLAVAELESKFWEMAYAN